MPELSSTELAERSAQFLLPSYDKIELKMTAKGGYYWTIELHKEKDQSNEDWVMEIAKIDSTLKAKFPVNMTVMGGRGE